MEPYKIRVFGIPKPGGSKRAFWNKALGRSMLVDACKKNKTWRKLVVEYAVKDCASRPMLDEPVFCHMEFIMPRPKYHYGTGKNSNVLKADAPYWHTVPPDALKLARSTEDALTGHIWRDDSTNVQLTTVKHYGDSPGCVITIYKAPAMMPDAMT